MKKFEDVNNIQITNNNIYSTYESTTKSPLSAKSQNGSISIPSTPVTKKSLPNTYETITDCMPELQQSQSIDDPKQSPLEKTKISESDQARRDSSVTLTETNVSSEYRNNNESNSELNTNENDQSKDLIILPPPTPFNLSSISFSQQQQQKQYQYQKQQNTSACTPIGSRLLDRRIERQRRNMTDPTTQNSNVINSDERHSAIMKRNSLNEKSTSELASKSIDDNQSKLLNTQPELVNTCGDSTSTIISTDSGVSSTSNCYDDLSAPSKPQYSNTPSQQIIFTNRKQKSSATVSPTSSISYSSSSMSTSDPIYSNLSISSTSTSSSSNSNSFNYKKTNQKPIQFVNISNLPLKSEGLIDESDDNIEKSISSSSEEKFRIKNKNENIYYNENSVLGEDDCYNETADAPDTLVDFSKRLYINEDNNNSNNINKNEDDSPKRRSINISFNNNSNQFDFNNNKTFNGNSGDLTSKYYDFVSQASEDINLDDKNKQNKRILTRNSTQINFDLSSQNKVRKPLIKIKSSNMVLNENISSNSRPVNLIDSSSLPPSSNQINNSINTNESFDSSIESAHWISGNLNLDNHHRMILVKYINGTTDAT